MEILIDKEKSYQNETKNFFSFCMVVFLFFLCFSLVTNYFFINVEVIGSSMENTFHGGTTMNDGGDVLYVSKYSKVSFGDVVVIDHKKSVGTNKYEYIIKRVIGTEGDTIVIKDGAVYRNGNMLDETSYIKQYSNKVYAKTSCYAGSSDFTTEKVWIVGTDEFFFLGDNRENSSDSRVYGMAKKDDIVGVVPSWSIKTKKFFTTKNQISVAIRKAIFGA